MLLILLQVASAQKQKQLLAHEAVSLDIRVGQGILYYCTYMIHTMHYIDRTSHDQCLGTYSECT